MKQPRILFIGPMLGRHPGWVPNTMELLAPKLRSNGYECHLVSTKLNRYLRFFDMIISMLAWNRRYDLVCLQVYAGRSFIVEDIVSRMARRMKKGLVYVLHGGNIPVFMRKHEKWFMRVLSRGHIRIVPSSYLEEALKNLSVPVRIIPNHFEIEDCPFRPRDRVAPRLLWMRTFDPVYNPEMAVRVIAEIVKTVPECTMTMAGQESGSLEEVRSLAVELGVDKHIRFPGFLGRDGKMEMFGTHDIFLNTNRVDNMPISVLEAAAFGLPIVATRVGGIPHLLKDGETALLVLSEDVASMARAVLRLLGENGLAAGLSMNGRKLAEKSGWERVKSMWEDAFNTAMIAASPGKGGR